MAFELTVHTPGGDFVLGPNDTRTAAEKMAAISVQPGERWSEVKLEGGSRPAAVIDFASYRAKRRARQKS